MLKEYQEKRDGLQKSLEQCEDVKAASDCVSACLERIRGEVRMALPPARREEADRLFRAASGAAALLMSATEAQVRVRGKVLALSGKEKLLSRLPFLSAALSLLLCVWMILIGQTIPAVLCVLLAAAGWLPSLRKGEETQQEYQVTTRVNVREAMRALDALMDQLERALAPEEEETAARAASEPLLLTDGLLSSVQMLLEAGCTRDGEYALKALPQIREALYAQGVEAVDYTPEHSEYFELFPSQRGGQTIRPAFLRDGRLVLRGQATEDIR